MVSRIIGFGLLIIFGLPLAIAFPPLAIIGIGAWFLASRKRAERAAVNPAGHGWHSAMPAQHPAISTHRGADRSRRRSVGDEFPFLMIVVILFSLVGMAARQPQFLTVPLLIVGAIILYKLFSNRPPRQVAPMFGPQPVMAAGYGPATSVPDVEADPAPVASSASVPTGKHFQAMSDAEFEQRVANLLRAAGYQGIQHVGEPGRQGIDLIARDRNGHLFLVHVQQHAPGDRAGSIDMQQLIDAVIEEKAAGGIFVTTATFTQAAINLAQYSRVPIVLYDGAALSRLAARPSARSWSAA